jgi:RimJ/RimL family protein N-acetyltransferase
MKSNYLFNNIKTGHNAELVLLNRLEDLVEADYNKLLLIFNQPGTYKLFGKGLNGLYLERDTLRRILTWYVEQAEMGSCYLYFIRDEKYQIMGGIDVQVKDHDEVSLGFWADERSSGYISGGINVLIDSLTDHNYKIINALTDPGNVRAISTLKRMGFENKGLTVGKSGDELLKFEISFNG